MTVIVDTPVWSHAYRRARRSPHEQAVVDELSELILDERAVLIGVIRQEILTGISNDRHFEEVRLAMRGFAELEATASEFEEAAALHNRCRRRGIQGSPTDFLICAVAIRFDVPIFTTDRDFKRYAEATGVRLHTSRPSEPE